MPGLERLGELGTPADETKNITGALDHFEERAVIREYDGGQSQLDAEAEALVEAARAFGVEVIKLRAAARVTRKARLGKLEGGEFGANSEKLGRGSKDGTAESN